MSGLTLRSTLRSIAKNPAFCATVIAIMALTIGSCTAIFSLVKSVLFFDLPYKDPDRLVVIRHSDARTTEAVGVWSRDYLVYRDTMRSFESVAAFSMAGFNLSNDEPAHITCSRVTANLLPMLGVAPFRGRWFTDAEDHDAANRVVILSYDMWRVRFGGDPTVLGKTITLDLKPYTVVGIMPASFAFPPRGLAGPLPMHSVGEANCLIPAAFTQAEMTLPSFTWIVLGKLKPGVSPGEARQDASIAAERIWQSYPSVVQKEVELRARVVPLREEMTASIRTPAIVFAGAVGFLLLTGCANVANLWLGKLHIRQREMSIRAALGAGSLSLIVQLLVESVMLAMCGGLIGIPFAFGILRVLVAFAPGNLPLPDRIQIDVWALTFTIACSVASGIMFGLAPALKTSNFNLVSNIAQNDRGSSAGLRHNKLRAMLAVAEIGMAFVLLAGAGLLLRSFMNLANVYPGFDPKNLVTFSVALPEEQYRSQAKIDQFVGNLLDDILRSDAIRFAAAASSLPIGPTDYGVFARPDAPPAVAGYKTAAVQSVTSEYLHAFGIALKRGRSFEFADDARRPSVALVNETMSRQYWPEADAVGKQFSWITPTGIRAVTIVGVVSDLRQEGLAAASGPSFYIPLAQSPSPVRNLVVGVRSALPLAAVASEIRGAVQKNDRALPVFARQPATELIRRSTGAERFNMFVVAMFAAGALVLAVSGLYAVISYLVIHSTHELGIRIALGATPGRILAMVMVRGFGYIATGLTVGIAAALSLVQFMRTLLFGIGGADASTFCVVTMLLTGVAFLSILIPAIRATRVDPIASLRR